MITLEEICMDESNSVSTPILSIPESTNYWLVRADGGKYYSDFLEDGFIAIANNKITIASINKRKQSSNSNNINYRELYLDAYPNESNQTAGLRANQIRRFASTMKINDIVLVPAKNSTNFLIGVITSSAYDANQANITKKIDLQTLNANHSTICPYTKRRDVTWIKEIFKNQLPKGLLWALSAHEALFHIQSIDDINSIDRLFSPLYIKNKNVHFLISAGTNENLTMKQWDEFISILKTADIDPKLIKVDIRRNSPVSMNLIATVIKINELYKLYKAIEPFLEAGVLTTGTGGTLLFAWRVIGGKRGKELGLVEWCQEIYRQHLENKKLKYKVNYKIAKQKDSELKRAKLHPKVSGTLILPESKSMNQDQESLSQSTKLREKQSKKVLLNQLVELLIYLSLSAKK
ncbi:hypothetical protein FD48_GL001274 [Lactiplantibacillus paraplantarum DSM 10667]|nr:hypothetical protein FD48_GL001274 [Lactiplantibacillus paraplantarum DSM 10667]